MDGQISWYIKQIHRKEKWLLIHNACVYMHILCILLYTHICVYIYICSGMHTYTRTLRPTEKEKRKRGRGRNLLTLSSTERKFVFISNLAIVQNNNSVMCEYCKHIAKVSQPWGDFLRKCWLCKLILLVKSFNFIFNLFSN